VAVLRTVAGGELQVSVCKADLAVALLAQGRGAEAEGLFEQAWALASDRLPAGHPLLLALDESLQQVRNRGASAPDPAGVSVVDVVP
jgi:hypothetical protein